MNTVERIQEARDILEALLEKRGSSPLLVKAHCQLELALSELFQDPDDVAQLADDPEPCASCFEQDLPF